MPSLQRNIRPATKRAFKTGIALYERGRERSAEFGEIASDIMAEARSEYDAEHGASASEGKPLASNEVVKLRSGRGKEVAAPNA